MADENNAKCAAEGARRCAEAIEEAKEGARG